eukprot:4429483-Alexandrium_andersonii.AAC.1
MNSSVSADAGASHGQKKFHANTEAFVENSPSFSRLGSEDFRCAASCSLSGMPWTASHRALPSKHGKPFSD